MFGSQSYPATSRRPIAVSLRVANVRRAAEFYQSIGFTFIMAVPDDSGQWLLCLLRYGSGSILIGAVDDPKFRRTTRPWRLQRRTALTVPNLAATYAACVAAGCRITAEPVEEIWGDRTFTCLDPFGYEWHFTQPAERVVFEQLPEAAGAVWS
jgi:uncharacterized glyoxalase superfamily protein PhnB